MRARAANHMTAGTTTPRAARPAAAIVSHAKIAPAATARAPSAATASRRPPRRPENTRASTRASDGAPRSSSASSWPCSAASLTPSAFDAFSELAAQRVRFQHGLDETARADVAGRDRGVELVLQANGLLPRPLRRRLELPAPLEPLREVLAQPLRPRVGRLARPGELLEDLVAEARPEVAVGVVPGVEADLDDLAAVPVVGRVGERRDLAAEQPHEVALARAPLAEQADGERHRRVPVGDDGGEHRHVVAHAQAVALEVDALGRVDEVGRDAAGELDRRLRRVAGEDLVPDRRRLSGREPRDGASERGPQLVERDRQLVEEVLLEGIVGLDQGCGEEVAEVDLGRDAEAAADELGRRRAWPRAGTPRSRRRSRCRWSRTA